MKVKAYTLNSFAKTKEGGNAAGVVMNADSLSEKEMRKVAAILEVKVGGRAMNLTLTEVEI